MTPAGAADAARVRADEMKPLVEELDDLITRALNPEVGFRATLRLYVRAGKLAERLLPQCEELQRLKREAGAANWPPP